MNSICIEIWSLSLERLCQRGQMCWPLGVLDIVIALADPLHPFPVTCLVHRLGGPCLTKTNQHSLISFGTAVVSGTGNNHRTKPKSTCHLPNQISQNVELFYQTGERIRSLSYFEWCDVISRAAIATRKDIWTQLSYVGEQRTVNFKEIEPETWSNHS